MSSLTFIEKQKLERIFGMSGGYVLNFSNRDFADLIQEACCIDIYDKKYQDEGNSKAKLLRSFWKIEDDDTVGRVLLSILEYLREFSDYIIDDDFLELEKIASRLLEKSNDLSQRMRHNNRMITTITYNSIIDNIKHCGISMEKTPGTYNTSGEEDLRNALLHSLNGEFKGKATGETFNGRGKTDILLQENGINKFIGECKIWKGKGESQKAIGQLLGYCTIRDTQTAIIIFNRNNNGSQIILEIKEIFRGHRLFTKILEEDEYYCRVVIKSEHDNNISVTISVIVINLPKSKEGI